ncbi:MAG: DEAD/DEAH box helicase, partial [bacterium]
MTAAFDRLAPFIQEFIWKRGWTDLRDIQTAAIGAVFDTDDHLLLAAGTASGKTEAAFLPILSQLYDDPPNTVGAVYIGPLKALINDQFLRLGELCEEAHIPVTAWHGDVAASRKHSLLKKPAGVLQITPEALEGLLLNRSADLMRVFGDLRWVVIDEIHAFMASDRGGQVLSLLDRLSRYAVSKERLPRRAGLSATLGDYKEAEAWLMGATSRRVRTITVPGERSVYLLVDHFMVKPRQEDSGEEPAKSEQKVDEEAAVTGALIEQKADLFAEAYSATIARKSLIFTNSRGDAEEMITALRHLAERKHTPDIYHVHHGSIAAPLREAAEDAMRDPEHPACTAATITLELGIDLGQLDRVVQLESPSSVASFLQRLGRAGRRGQRPEMLFLIPEDEHQAGDVVVERLPWDLLQAIAIIQLYAEEKWIEPIYRPSLPGSLLYQQTMSVIGASGELTPRQIAERVLTLSPFRKVTQDQLKALLLHLIAIDHLERTEEGGLILGLCGEKVVRSYRFLATFVDNTEWTVKEGTRDIGTIGQAVPPEERFALAGRTWEVVEVVDQERLLIVKRVKSSVRTLFRGLGGPRIHDRVVERMRQALTETAEYAYLTDRARERLSRARALATATRIAEGPCVVPLGGDRLCLVPWCGTQRFFTMLRWVAGLQGARLYTAPGFYIGLRADSGKADELAAGLAALSAETWDGAAMAAALERSVCQIGKYDEFLPEPLLKQGFVADQLDVEGARLRLREM